MSASDPESWARLRLAQGESNTPTLELKGAQGQTTLTVGHSQGCSWIVRDDEVAPVHFSLHWDGRTLRIADVYGAGGVRVDGEPVGAQWRALSGRMRVDFGKAAIVVETAVPMEAQTDPTPLPPIEGARRGSERPAPANWGRGVKATLLGVAPVEAGSPASSKPPSAPPQDTSASPSQRPGEAEFGSRRPGESERSHKPTLLGLASVPPGPPPASSAPPPPASSSPPGAGPMSNATLMGFGTISAPLEKRAGALLAEDRRTVQGFPVGQDGSPTFSGPTGGMPGRATQQGGLGVPGPSEQPRSQAPAHAVGTPSGKRLHEMDTGSVRPGSVRPAGPTGEVGRGASQRVPQAVLIADDPSRAAGASAPEEVYAERPSRMHDPALLENHRTKRRFPWRYLGVGVLTAAAYFAWLYLLDHL